MVVYVCFDVYWFVCFVLVVCFGSLVFDWFGICWVVVVWLIVLVFVCMLVVWVVLVLVCLWVGYLLLFGCSLVCVLLCLLLAWFYLC